MTAQNSVYSSDALHSKHSFTGGASTLIGGFGDVDTKRGSSQPEREERKISLKPISYFRIKLSRCDSVRELGNDLRHKRTDETSFQPYLTMSHASF